MLHVIQTSIESYLWPLISIQMARGEVTSDKYTRQEAESTDVGGIALKRDCRQVRRVQHMGMP